MAKKRKHGGKGRKARQASAARRAPAGQTPAPAKEPTAEPAPVLRDPSGEVRARLARAQAAAARPAEPAFWFGFEVAWAKLVLARVVLFGLLAVDALMQIRHAPRYGAGGFNVAQLPGLDALGPTRLFYELGELVNAYLFVLAACGAATRIAIPLATAIYAWLYFGSQLDSYQHHYLISLILLLACFVPWTRPADATPATPVRSWALRLILIQLGIMYLWAAVSKMNPAWLDGRTLGGQIGGPMRDLVDATVGVRGASRMVMLVEVILAGTVWLRPAWRVAAPLGIALHVGILFSKLEIGLFAWLMIGLYVLIVPDRIWVWLAETAPLRGLRAAASIVGGWFDGGARWIVWVFAAGLGVALAAACRFEHALAVAGVASAALVLAAGLAIARRGGNLAWLAMAHLLACATWFTVDRSTTIAADYFRFWGGTSRRLGDTATAEHAYRELTRIDPDTASGHFQLGRLLLARDAADAGLAELHRAEELEPDRARAFTAEARWLASHGRSSEALAKAREAAAAEPGNAEARQLVESFAGGRAEPPAPGPATEEPDGDAK